MRNLPGLSAVVLSLVMGVQSANAAEKEVGREADRSVNKAPEVGIRPNILLITADDLNYDSLGVTGSKTPGITPNLDRLAAGGLRFVHGHVTIAVCQPCRSVLMTGRYPYRNGAQGFQPINTNVPTLQESLSSAGYLNGILGKTRHLAPASKFCWDTVVGANQLGAGRSPALYYRHAKAFFEKAKAAGRPFFLMANSHDPHRPFAGSEQEQRLAAGRRKRGGQVLPKASRCYKPDEIEVPGFLPDLPEVRTEVAQYYTSVHRCDETVGEVLRALRETGLEDNTMVMFLSDHGMAFPFAKTNCYLASTRTPWIIRWPGRIKPGTVDARHLISGIDFMPTVLEAAGLPSVPGMDGRSFLPVMLGKQQEGRDYVYTVFHRTAARRDYPMRCLQNRQFGYLFNPWSDGRTVFKNESQSGLTFKAMQRAAENDKQIAKRVRLFQYRAPEEFYDFQNDPYALKNLIDDPRYRDRIDKLRARMLEVMQATGDPLLPAFRKRLTG